MLSLFLHFGYPFVQFGEFTIFFQNDEMILLISLTFIRSLLWPFLKPLQLFVILIFTDNCCVFQILNGGFGCHLLVKIIFFICSRLFPFNTGKKKKRAQKGEIQQKGGKPLFSNNTKMHLGARWKKIYFAAFCRIFFFIFMFFIWKMWKSLFLPAFGMCSSQILVKYITHQTFSDSNISSLYFSATNFLQFGTQDSALG